MKKVLLTIFCILLYIFLFLILLIEFFYALCGGVSWLIVLSILILILIGTLKLRGILNWKNFNIVLIIILVMIPSIIAIGSNDRAGTKSERQYILNYLEEKYEGSKFELINLQFKNEELTGWDHMFEFNTFKWNNFEATYKDENGVVFKVYGYNEGFNNITSVVDDYFVIKTVNECYQYDNKVYDISTGI